MRFGRIFLRLALGAAAIGASLGGPAPAATPASEAATITLPEAVERALRHTARGDLIAGDVDVAEDLYQAKRINFFVPSISLLGSVPSYSVDESYRFFGGSTRKRLYKTRGLGYQSFIQLEQSLLTGGRFNVKANLTADENRYPDTDPMAPLGSFLDERSRNGYFDFTIEQPILKPSTPRHDLADRRSDLEIARLNRQAEETKLRREVTEAYLGLLLADLGAGTAEDKLEAARLQADIDSAKWQDGIVSQDGWLASASKRLDAELSLREAEAASEERRRDLALLLDLADPETIGTLEPLPPAILTAAEQARLLEDWEQSRDVRLAAHQHDKAHRAARFAAGGHGLTGELRANYTFGRGNVKVEHEEEDQLRTNGWGVALDFTYPVWDGGAAAAAVRAARYQAERARLELERARRTARAEIQKLLDQCEVSGRRLEILSRQADLAAERLRIATERFEDERINRLELLQAKITLLEARGKYLTELKNHEVNRIELFGRFEE